MASETVDPIDWSHPPPYTGQYPCIAHRNAGWAANHKTYCTERASIVRPSECQTYALPVRPHRIYRSTNKQLPIAVDLSQLRTMALEMVDPIHWPLTANQPKFHSASASPQMWLQPLYSLYMDRIHWAEQLAPALPLHYVHFVVRNCGKHVIKQNYKI